MTSIWTARHTKQNGDPAFCRASVADRESGSFAWLHSHQCTRKPICVRVVGGKEYGFCKQHDPEEIETRDKAKQKQWRLEREAKDRAYDRQIQEHEAMTACKEAIEQIASGHNDPRALAAETLKLFPGDKP